MVRTCLSVKKETVSTCIGDVTKIKTARMAPMRKTAVSSITPASNLGYLAPLPGQFFMDAKLFIGTPWMGNEGVLKKILVWAM